MIIEFSVGNFRSFKDVETLSMVAAPIRSKDKELDSNNVTVVNDKLSLLRSKAIYGANASGKSNIMKAFLLFKKLVRLSIVDENIIRKACDDFVLDGGYNTKPVFYQLLFLYENSIWRYGFEVMSNAVVSEWLYNRPATRDSKLFTREVNKVSVNSSLFGEAKKFEKLAENGDSDIFQNHSLFLSATAAVNVKLSRGIQQFINRMSLIDTTETVVLKENAIHWWVIDTNRKSGIELLKAADTGVENISLLDEEVDGDNFPSEPLAFMVKESSQKIPTLISSHKISIGNNRKEVMLETVFESFESEGTQKFLYLIPFIIDTLEAGTTLWIDEFDARLHPLLTKKIVSLFHSTDTNPHGAQLIFATHDTNLLKPSFLRRDQICFVEKDKYGASHLKTLVEYKGVRNDASYDKDYLQGRYGAVPFLNELDEAVEKSIANNG